MAVIPVTSGLQLLLDARTITGLSDGDPLSVTWADQSGKGNNAAQGTAANRPTFETNVFGSNPAVSFKDQSDHVHGSLATWGTHAGVTLIGCSSNFPASQAGGARFFSCTPTGGTDSSNGFMILHAGLNPFLNGANVPQASPITLGPAGTSQPIIWGSAMNGTNLDQIVNGVVSTKTHSSGLPAAPTIYSTGYIDGGVTQNIANCIHDAHFFCLWNRRLSGVEIEDVCCWMRSELGMQTPMSGGTSGFTGLSGVGRLGT